jgi:hypothetical protein
MRKLKKKCQSDFIFRQNARINKGLKVNAEKMDYKKKIESELKKKRKNIQEWKTQKVKRL